MISAKIHPSVHEGETEEDSRAKDLRIAKENDLKHARRDIWDIMKRLHGMNAVALFLVLLFILCRSLVNKTCATYPVIITPHFVWYALWDYGFLIMLGGTVIVTATNVVARTCMQLSMGEMILIVAVYTISNVVLVIITLTYMRDPSAIRYSRIISTIIALSAWILLEWRKSMTLKSPVADVSIKRRFRKQNNQIVVMLLKFAVSFFGGFYFALTFSDRMFPTIVEKVKASYPTGSGLEVIATEVALISAFYSVFFPMWSKLIAHYTQEICRFYSFNPNSSKRAARASLTNVGAAHRCSFFVDDVTNLTTQQMALMSENVLVRAMIMANFWLDTTRFIYGRGILFKLSSEWLFFLVVFKDICYQVWHFVFKFVDWVLVFTLKVFHCEGLGNVSRWWQVLAQTIEFIVRLGGIPKALCASWDLPVDYAALKGREGETTDCTVKLTFCNVSIRLKNLPLSLKADLLQVQRHVKSDLHVVEDDVTDDEWGTEQQSRRGGGRADAVSKSLSNRDEQTEEALSSTPPVTCKGGVRLDAIVEEPVTAEDKHNFQDVVAIIQTQIFMRYQVRAAAKIFTASVFLFVPLLARYTASSYHPFFSEFDFMGDSAISKRYRTAAITFLLVDIIEWVLFTHTLLRKADHAAQMTRYFYGLISCRDTPLIVMCFFAAFSGAFLFQTRWNPFTLNAINTSLGLTGEDKWAWETAYEKCF
eukprot:GEMP01020508.1.p1 GENE.GEMP01020508.1~~GEMP01020508.1.p1  ORF type:complete len:705 (+),score=56.41 GEMP01020508.1:90-2204(+)